MYGDELEELCIKVRLVRYGTVRYGKEVREVVPSLPSLDGCLVISEGRHADAI